MAPLFILYAYPDWLPAGRRVLIYLAEKKISPSFVYAVESDEDAQAKGYPPKRGNFCPIMAVSPRPGADTNADSHPTEYIWIEQSAAILEMLEDYCDANPDASPVPSLRGGPVGRRSDINNNIVRRAMIRGIQLWADSLFEQFGAQACFGSENVARARGTTVNQTTAREMEHLIRHRILEPLERVIDEVVDFAGIAEGKEGCLTVGDINLFVSWEYCAELCGKDPLSGSGRSSYPNFRRFVEACKKRRNIPQKGEYPDVVKGFASGWVADVWN